MRVVHLILTGLELFNFRNYQRQQVEFSPDRNVVTGSNAQGKSNLLEAVYFLSHFKSNRATRMRDLVLEGEERASVRGVIMDGEVRLSVHVSFGRQGKCVEVNGQRAGSASRARGLLKCVMFSPEDLYMVKGDPGRRRDFMDETMEGLGPGAAKKVVEYRHVLKQRNAVLRSWEEHGTRLTAVLGPWNEALVKAGAPIVTERARMLSEMRKDVESAYRAVAGEEKKVSIEYVSSFEQGERAEGSVEEMMRKALEKSGRDEKRFRNTVIGPHRDDVEIRLGERETRFSASQGEQRTLSFCMRIAQRKYLETTTGKVPIMLLDDVLSELDSDRRAGVLEVAGAGSQAIVTTTEPPGALAGAAGKVFRVERGKVTVV